MQFWNERVEVSNTRNVQVVTGTQGQRVAEQMTASS